MQRSSLIYYSLVAGLSGGILFMAVSMLRNSIVGKPTYIAVHTPFEMFVEFPIIFILAFAVLTWTVHRIFSDSKAGRRGTAVIMLLALFPALMLPATVNAQSEIFAWDPSVGFYLPAYGAVSFARTAYFSSFGWDSWNASKVYFYNAMLEGDDSPLDFVGISVIGANATIASFNRDGAMHIILSAPSGAVSYLILDLPQTPQAVRILYCGRDVTVPASQFLRDWSLFAAAQPPAVYISGNMLAVKTRHCSESEVFIAFQAVTVTETQTTTVTVTTTQTTTVTRSVVYTPLTVPATEPNAVLTSLVSVFAPILGIALLISVIGAIIRYVRRM